MNLVEIEALLFRTQDNYPSAQPPRPGTAREWSTSALARFDASAVFAAFDVWREAEMWPPSLTDLIAGSQRVMQARAAQSEAEAVAAANFEELYDPERTFSDGLPELFRCGRCHDERWVPIDRDDVLLQGPLMPCPECRPATWEVWKGGHYRPGHTCGECVARRSKRGHAA